MAISINWPTGEITVPRADMAIIQVSPEIRQLDTPQFWIDLKDLEASEQGMPWTDTQQNFPSYTIQGIVYAQAYLIIGPYFITFEDGQYAVSLSGTNNNILEVATQNQVRLASQNSAGLQIVEGALSDQQSQELSDIHGQTLREIWVDETFPTNGNFGYQQAPFNVWEDAVDYAEGPANLTTMVTLTDATFDRNLKNFTIRGLGFPTIDLNGQDVDKTSLSGVTITGIHLGQLLVQDSGLQNVSGEVLAQRVAIGGTYLVRGGSFSILTSVAVLIPGLPWTLDLGVSDTDSVVGLADVSGGIVLDNIEGNDVVHVHMAQGAVTINASCTGGFIVITGSALITDNSAGSNVNTDAMNSELVFTREMENGETFEDQTRLIRADAAGDVDEPVDGTYAIRDAADTKDRIVGTQTANGGRNVTSTDGT